MAPLLVLALALLRSGAEALDMNVDLPCVWGNCPFCVSNFTQEPRQLQVATGDGKIHFTPVLMARPSATSSWASFSMAGTVVGILAREYLGLEIQYVDCDSSFGCAGMMVPKSEAATPDVFVAMEIRPGYNKGNIITQGPIGYFYTYGVYLYSWCINDAWTRSGLDLTAWRGLASLEAVTYLDTPRKLMQDGVVPNVAGCPSNWTVSQNKTASSSLVGLLKANWTCTPEGWWLAPACAAMGASWIDLCFVVADDDWGYKKPELYNGLSVTGSRAAKITLGYTPFYNLVSEHMYNVTFLWWSTDTQFVNLNPARVSFPANAEVIPGIMNKLMWDQASQNSKPLRTLVANVGITTETVQAMLKQILQYTDAGKPFDDQFDWQKAGCDWIRANHDVWSLWIPNPNSCAAGEAFKPSLQACESCPPGTNASQDMTKCLPCPAGFYQDQVSQAKCKPCSLGTYTPSPKSELGATECLLCDAGFYSSTWGRSSCLSCGSHKQNPLLWSTLEPIQVNGVEQWTPVKGAFNENMCGCLPGAFMEQGECEACTEGMICVGDGKMRLNAGYASFSSDPFSLFTCFQDASRCPGGTPGSCADGRHGVACSDCHDNYYPSGSLCLPCSDADASIFYVAAFFLCLCFCLLVWAVLRQDLTKQPSASLTLFLSTGQLCVAFQTIRAIHAFKITVQQPLLAIFQFFDFLSIDFHVIRYGCALGKADPVTELALTLILYPVIIVFVFLAIVPSLIARRYVDITPIINLCGSTLMILFISITLKLLLPWQCLVHPNGVYTMASDGGVICWQSTEHRSMLGISVFGLLLYTVGVLACVVFFTKQYPNLLHSGRGLKLLLRVSFLWRQFKPDYYYFGLLTLTRNILVALLPVALVSVPGILVFCMAFLMVLSLIVHVKYWPLVVESCNVLELIIVTALLLLLVGLGPLVNVSATTQQIQLAIICCVCFLCLALSGLGSMIIALYHRFKRSKDYAMFLCHHKAGAGAFCRLLKLKLSKQTRAKVFLDSDELDSLDALFDIVRTSTCKLVVVLTSQVLSRMWCAGEIVTANRNHVPMLLLQCDDFVEMDAEQLDKIPELWSPQETYQLMKFGISVSYVQEAYRSLSSCFTIKTNRFHKEEDEDLAVHQLIQSCSLKAPSLRVRRSIVRPQLAVLGSMKGAESVSICRMIRFMIQYELKQEVAVLDKDVQLHTLSSLQHILVPLSQGILRDFDFAHMLLSLEEFLEPEGQPEYVPLNIDNSFEFPGSFFYEQMHSDPVFLDIPTEEKARFCRVLKVIFASLALPFNPLASEVLLTSQIHEICRRRIHRSPVDKKPTESFKEAKSTSIMPPLENAPTTKIAL